MLSKYINIIRFIAANYRQRCPWVADVRDLEQEGAHAAVEVLRKKSQFVGLGGERAYVVRAVALAIRERAWRDFFPVSVRHCPSAVQLAKLTAARYRRVDVDAARNLHTNDSPEERLATEQIRRHVLRALDRLADERPDCMPGIHVLHGGVKPADVAQVLGLPVVNVYRATALVRQRLAADPELRSLWQEVSDAFPS